MAAEDNKALVRYLIEEVLNKGNLDIADTGFAPDYVTHIPNNPNLPPGPETFKRVIAMYRAAFPDFHMTIEDLVAEGDLVANRFTTRGTHRAPLMGIPPTGKQITVRGQELHRIANGKVVESWICDDVPSILVQLGIITMPQVGQAGGAPVRP